MRLQKYKVGQKTLAPIFVLLVLFAAFFIYSVSNLNSYRSEIVTRIESSKAIINNTAELSRVENDTERLVIAFHSRRDPSVLGSMADLDAEFMSLIGKIKENSVNEEQRALLAKYLSFENELLGLRARLIAADLAGRNSAAVYGEWLAKRKEVNGVMRDILSYNTRFLDENAKVFNEKIDNTIFIFIAQGAAILLMIFGFLWYLSKTVLLPLKKLGGKVEEFLGEENGIKEDELKMLERALSFSQNIKKSYLSLEQSSREDLLTGLDNRATFNEKAESILKENKCLTICLVDLDRFKNVNNSLGHGIGDLLLKEIGNRIKKSIRRSDLAARFGGDELIILLRDTKSVDEVGTAAAKILENLREPFQIRRHSIFITASIGIAMSPSDAQNLSSLLKCADIALYAIKSKGRNWYQFYHELLDVPSTQRIRLESDLRTALKKDQLQIYFQPIVDLKTDTLSSCEALVRWHHPEFGIIMPSDFIVLAEETGLIIPLGKVVFEKACAARMKWLEEGVDVPVAVNCSPAQFYDPDFLEGITDKCSGIQIEITESTAFEDTASAAKKIKKLKEMGIDLSMDDFGTGYSSLSYLKRIPFKKLKIGKNFVQDCFVDGYASTIVKTIVKMSHDLGFKVVAEGVEIAPQVDFLKSIGCDEMQGFFVSEPLSLESFINWYKARRFEALPVS